MSTKEIKWQHRLTVIRSVLALISFQDHACLTLLARCLTLVPVKDLENIVDADTQVSKN